MKMHLNRQLRYVIAVSRGLLLFAVFFTASTFAGEIESIAWDGTGSLRVQVKGTTNFRTESLESGQRLRIIFPESTLGSGLREIPGQGIVKGVYPYLADNGTSVNVDLLLTEASRLDVQRVDSGFRVTATAATAPFAATPVSEQTTSASAVPSKHVITEILHAKLPGERVQITVRMSGPPPEPSAFVISNPAQIALDFSNTRVDLAKKTVNVKEGAVTSVTAVGAEDRTRLIVKLIGTVPYRTAIDGNNFVLTLDAPAVIASADQAKVTHFASGRKDARFQLKSVDFRRGPQGDGKIIIALSDPAVGIDIREQAGEIVLDFGDTSVGSELQRRLDVVDFATPVQSIDTFTQGKNTRMVISPKGKYEHIAYQTGNVLTVSVKPIIERPDEKKVDEFGYSGEKLSLNFQNIEVRAALQVLADFTGLNFVVSDTVKGSLTLRLKDVPWDQALDLIVDTKGLAIRRKGNVVTIAPATEVAAKDKASFEASKAAVELEPLVSELIRVNYAKAEEVANLLKSIKQVSTTAFHPVFGQGAANDAAVATAQSAQSNTLLSSRGQVTVDVRTNTLLVQDTPGKIREIRKLIAQLDQPVRQVMVETRLVEARDTYAKNLGSRLANLSQRTKGSTSVTSSGKIDVLPPLNPPGGGESVYEIIPSGLLVNLAAAGAGGFNAGTFMIDFFKGGTELTLELSALEQSGQGKVISSPRVITANQRKAIIEQGQEQAIQTSVLGVGGVVTKKATLKLEVTPQITPDDRINLDVNIAKDDFAATGSNPLLNVKQIQTQVLLDNGETVVIGGIYEQTKTNTTTQVPFFGDLPLLGWLFKNKSEVDNKTELLIFLTPRILSDRLTLR